MVKSWIYFCVILLFGYGETLDTYYMDVYCGNTIDLSALDTFAGRLSIYGGYVGDCNVTLQAWLDTDNRIGFYFENFLLGPWEVDCLDTYLAVYDGPNTEFAPPMHGLHRECGDRKPGGTFYSSSKQITVRYFNKEEQANTVMDIVFTAFHRGLCYSNEYECSNGHCIDDSVNCNGFNPCGDGSDCRLSATAIVGIVVGAVFIICVATACVVVVRRNRQRKYNNLVDGYMPPNTALLRPPYDLSTSTVVRGTTPPPSYGIAQQYSTQATYKMPTSIQGDK